jgi:hypothetical protein
MFPFAVDKAPHSLQTNSNKQLDKQRSRDLEGGKKSPLPPIQTNVKPSLMGSFKAGVPEMLYVQEQISQIQRNCNGNNEEKDETVVEPFTMDEYTF